MSLEIPDASTLTFDRFWAWLRRHRNCVLRVGSGDTYLYDQESSHWQFTEDDDRNPIVQLAMGKNVLGEIVIVLRDVMFVQGSPDPVEDDPERVLFEVINSGTSGAQDDGVVCHFLLAHGFDETVPHARALKH